DRLPAADRAGADDDDRVAEAHAERLNAVHRARERVRHGGQVRREVRGEGDQVLDGDGWDGGVLRVSPWERVIAVKQVAVAEVLEAVRTPPAVTAGEDRPEEHAVAFIHPRGENRARANQLEDSDRLVAEDPRRRGPGIAVEERPGVGAADAAGLDAKDRAARRQGGVGGPARPRRRQRPPVYGPPAARPRRQPA